MLWVWYYLLKYLCLVLACVTIPSMHWSSVQNACEPASEGGMQSDMAYCPAMGFLAHSMVHSVFIFAHSCQWSFAIYGGGFCGRLVYGEGDRKDYLFSPRSNFWDTGTISCATLCTEGKIGVRKVIGS